MNPNLEKKLLEFYQRKVLGKGALAVIIFISRIAKDKNLPLNPDDILSESGGQVQGLGREAVQRILADYNISQVLAEEGGRTSRGSIANMRDYIEFLNNLHANGLADTNIIEAWWIARIRDHFAAKPLRLRYDPSKSLQVVIQDILEQAKKLQKENKGTTYQGAVLQHLIGAKLELSLPSLKIIHHGFTAVADAVSNRTGDFMIDDSVIHITLAPSEAVIRKCKQNLESNSRPIIFTIDNGIAALKVLTENAGLTGRIEIMDARQFLAANLYELSLFKTSAYSATLEKLVETYNRIISDHETDPSLKIEMI